MLNKVKKILENKGYECKKCENAWEIRAHKSESFKNYMVEINEHFNLKGVKNEVVRYYDFRYRKMTIHSYDEMHREGLSEQRLLELIQEVEE
jgi:hypothetical protein